MPDFNGFSKELPKYFQNLKKNNSKPWFEKHRNDYDEFVMSPARDMMPIIPMLNFCYTMDCTP